VSRISTAFKIILLLLLLSFALTNGETVSVKYLFGLEWQMPLSLAILCAFAAGLVIGLSALVLPLIRVRRELRRLHKLQRKESHGT
jgi:putative membrane protein